MDVGLFLSDITTDRRYRDQIVHVETIQARDAKFAQPRAKIPETLCSLLRRENITRLYTHQATAIDHIASGRDVVIVTSTASGKTLCYNIPVASALLEDPAARALYMFPTKALTQDQFAGLQRLSTTDELKDVLRPAVYDGDTDQETDERVSVSRLGVRCIASHGSPASLGWGSASRTRS